MNDLTKRGNRIARAAGPGNEVQSRVGRNRDRVTVRTATPEAKAAQHTRGALLKALQAGR